MNDPSQSALPPLPEPRREYQGIGRIESTGYTADQMRAYALAALAAPAVQAESSMLDKAEWIADEFGASNDSKETREAHAAAIVEAMQAVSKGVPAAQSADAAILRELLDEVRPYVADAPRDPYGDRRPESIDHELLSRIDAALSQSAAAAKEAKE